MERRKRRRTKSNTIPGVRIPVDILILAKREQIRATRLGKKISLQDAFRKLARRLQ